MLVFKPWRKFVAFYNRARIRTFLSEVADDAEKTFKAGVNSPPKTGVKYPRLPNRSSIGRAEAEYPATQSGALSRSIRSRATATEATVGSDTEYSIYLRNGTSKMRRRKMSDTALRNTIPRLRERLRGWAEWKR